jgi:hypothetical protein
MPLAFSWSGALDGDRKESERVVPDTSSPGRIGIATGDRDAHGRQRTQQRSCDARVDGRRGDRLDGRRKWKGKRTAASDYARTHIRTCPHMRPETSVRPRRAKATPGVPGDLVCLWTGLRDRSRLAVATENVRLLLRLAGRKLHLRGGARGRVSLMHFYTIFYVYNLARSNFGLPDTLLYV